METPIKDIIEHMKRQNERHGSKAINLIACENLKSLADCNIEINDIMGSYFKGHPNTQNEDHRY